MKKTNLKIMMIFSLIIVIFALILLSKKRNNYNLEDKIEKYSLNVYQNKEKMINYLKEKIKPIKIRNFIDSKYVSISILKKDATLNDVLRLTNFIGYKMLFMSMFDKERKGFDDCPVTPKFKEKFKTNLLEHFNLIISDDCESDCLLNIEEQKLEVEVYGEFENTEPTKGKTYHFHYTLDDEGNVDDVTMADTQ